MNSIELYEQTLEDDQSIIQLLIDEINSLISLNIEEVKPRFYYDTTPVTENLDIYQTNRIMDEVIFYFRKRGIRIVIANSEIENAYKRAIEEGVNLESFLSTYNFFYSYYNWYPSGFRNLQRYNYVGRKNYIFQITLNIRLGREYMKSYC